jgi:hypothetical protein
MKVELIKQTTKYTGKVYYFVNIEGEFQSHTFTSDKQKAESYFAEAMESAKKYPDTVNELVREVIF